MNIRSSAGTTAAVVARLGSGSVVTIAGTVSGGWWSTICPTSKSGSTWYQVTAIDGMPVSSLYGPSVLYAATGVLTP